MIKPYSLFAFLTLFSILSVFSSNTLTEEERWQNHAKNTEIIRDNFGVPHIYGKTDADAVFGLLYAQCEDDFNRVEHNYIWAIGRLAEIEGEKSLYSDLRARLYMSQSEAEKKFNESPEWLKQLCIAFADGINYYLYTHPEVKPKLLTRFEPWMPMYFSEGSIGGDIERVSIKKIKAFYENGTELPKLEAEKLKLLTEMAEPKGSNGIAISGDLTASGAPLLLINPHTSFYFRGEVHMVSEEGLNAYGAVTWGQFFVYQGFNEHTGWMHTSSDVDVIDEFKETVVKRNSRLFYQYGNTLKPVDSALVTLHYKDGKEVKQKNFTTYKTHHGPITHLEDGQWTASAIMWYPVNALKQSFIRTKQSDYEGFRDMMDIKTNSSNNTVYADSQGNIAYFHGNFIPKRDTQFDYRFPVDGSNPKTDWNGLHSVDENILLLNPKNGWIQNCNSTPYTAALNYSPKKTDYPAYMSRDHENFRGVHAISLLKDTKDFTLDKLITLAYDPYLPAFKVLIPGLIEAYKQSEHKELLKAPIDVLSKWDYTTSTESVAMSLANYYGRMYFKEVQRPSGLSTMELLAYWGHNSPLEERLKIFELAVEKLHNDFGSWEVPWGDINRYQRINGDIYQAFDDNKPSIAIGYASGTWGALAAYGANYTNNTKKIYGTRGNSFVAVVEFGDKVKAKSLLAGGQSGDPDSPHFSDQEKLYQNCQFKTVPYYKEDVLKRAKSQYHPGEKLK
ncbi:penicillin acylase family protein [Formosa sp. S-31]|uniref:penicillin acylase family protein n=1 Tax=Formosa sp. S-31 TaxID=2790949 RepID=UPI003EB80463